MPTELPIDIIVIVGILLEYLPIVIQHYSINIKNMAYQNFHQIIP